MLRKILYLLAFLIYFGLPLAMAGVEGMISGTVVDAQGVALPHARVELYKDGKLFKQIESSDTGSFTFYPLNVGDYEVLAQVSGQTSTRTLVHVASGDSTQLEIQLQAPSSEMVVEVKAKKRLLNSGTSASRTSLNQKEIRLLPQGSETTLPRLLSTTAPGVVQGPLGQPFIRGNHGNIQYQIDGVQLPESPTNTFGQVFSPRNIDNIEIITGAIPAEYGLRLGGVMNIVTKSGQETPGGEIELNYGSYNATTPHLMYGGSNESGNLRYFLSLNYNRTDRGIDTPQPESISNQRQGGAESIHNTASGNSEFGRLDWQVDNSNKLTFSLFHAQSEYQIPNYPSSFSPSSPFFSQPEYEDQFGNHGEDGNTTFNYVPANTNVVQFERNAYLQTVWKHTFNERSFLQLAPYYKYSQLVVTPDPVNELYTAPGGAFPITGANPTSFAENRHVNNLGLKGDYSFRASDAHLVKAGFQLQASQASGFYSVQRSLNGTIPTISESSPTEGFFESVYLQDDYRIFKPLLLSAGLRFDATQFAFSGLNPTDSLLQPRIKLTYSLTETTQLHAYYGKLFQPSPVENLRTTFDAVNPNPAPYDIKAEKDDFYEIGVSQQFGAQVASLAGYYKHAVNMLDEAQLLNTSISQPYNYETGFAYGVEVSVRGQITDDWSEYVNYAHNVAMGQGLSGGAWASDEPPGAGYQLLDHVQLHTANAGLTYSKNFFWWTTQGIFGSGLRTGHDKGIALPAHFTLDTTVGYEFHGKSWLSQFKLSGDVLNIFDNRYPITIANGFNGSHYAVGRQFFIRLTKYL